ncbi:sterol desaturase, putative, partial [Perkinsus marinus ATCC 50983]
MPVIFVAWIVGNAYAHFVLLYLTTDEFVFGELPKYQTIVRDMVAYMLIEEVGLYYLHRLFHEWKAGYRVVHKLHHTFTSPVPLQALYNHPLDQVIINVTPILAGPIIMQSHILTFALWLTFSFVNTLVSHSGYNFVT